MKKVWLMILMVALMTCLAASFAVASGQPGPPDGEPVAFTTLEGPKLYVTPENREIPNLTPAERETWFDYSVRVPEKPSVPIEVRELGIGLKEFTFLKKKSVERPDGTSVDGLPIMNLDVFGKIGIGAETRGGRNRFDDPVIVDIPEPLVRVRTRLSGDIHYYFVLGKVAYTPEEFAERGNITDVNTTGGLSFRILDWPVDDLMIISEGR